MNRVTLAHGSSIALPCRIEPSDVEAMLDAYDSGMSDASTTNCISLAVSRMLRSKRPLPLFRYNDSHAALGMGNHRVTVPPDLLRWLASAETGGQSGPMEFVLNVPADVLARPSRPEPQRIHHSWTPRRTEPDRSIAV